MAAYDPKVVVITGGALGIGRAYALEFARERARILDTSDRNYLRPASFVAAFLKAHTSRDSTEKNRSPE